MFVSLCHLKPPPLKKNFFFFVRIKITTHVQCTMQSFGGREESISFSFVFLFSACFISQCPRKRYIDLSRIFIGLFPLCHQQKTKDGPAVSSLAFSISVFAT